jgi:hypothetical protein
MTDMHSSAQSIAIQLDELHASACCCQWVLIHVQVVVRVTVISAYLHITTRRQLLIMAIVVIFSV